MGYAEDDPKAQSRLAAFKKRLNALGWTEGNNLQIDTRWAGGDVNRAAGFAKELLVSQPEVILSNTTPVTAALHRETKKVPLVFLIVSDPIGSGFVESLPRPGGNVTGFINLELSLVEKWLELLKEIAPAGSACRRHVQSANCAIRRILFAALRGSPRQNLASSRSRQQSATMPISKQLLQGSGVMPNGGLIAMTDSFLLVHRKLVIDLTTRHKVPSMYFLSEVPCGRWSNFLWSRCIPTNSYKQHPMSTASYVVPKPADLPVQVPTKYELDINLKTAKALGLDDSSIDIASAPTR